MVARRISLWVAFVAAACGGARDPGAVPRLTVFAAASTAEVVAELGRVFPGTRLRTSFGPSSGLARQIGDGAPADVFVSANRHWVDVLQRAGSIAGEPRAFCRNRLVCVVATGSALRAAPPADAVTLAERIAPADRIAIADAGVPAGGSARQALERTKAIESVQPHLVALDDVRSVVRAVATGQAVAGFAYTTDARVAGVELLFVFPASSHEPVEYFAAATSVSDQPRLAGEFLDFLSSPAAASVLEAGGFEVVPR